MGRQRKKSSDQQYNPLTPFNSPLCPFVAPCPHPPLSSSCQQCTTPFRTAPSVCAATALSSSRNQAPTAAACSNSVPMEHPSLREASLFENPVTLSCDVSRIHIRKPSPPSKSSSGLISVPIAYRATHEVPYINPFPSARPVRFQYAPRSSSPTGADKGNMHATLIYGLSMGFCFGQHDEAVKYLAKIKDHCCVADYAYGILMIERPETRSEGMLVLKRLQLIGTEDHLHLCRMQLL